jgi:hypothetical protein
VMEAAEVDGALAARTSVLDKGLDCCLQRYTFSCTFLLDFLMSGSLGDMISYEHF